MKENELLFLFGVTFVLALLIVPLVFYLRHSNKVAEQQAEEREKKRQQEEAQKTEQQKEEEQKQRQAEEQEQEQKQNQQRIENTLAVADSLSSFNSIMLIIGIFGCIIGFLLNFTIPIIESTSYGGYKETRVFNPNSFSYLFYIIVVVFSYKIIGAIVLLLKNQAEILKNK